MTNSKFTIIIRHVGSTKKYLLIREEKELLAKKDTNYSLNFTFYIS
jgi:hypothetical protein